jgi:periplasmic protein TonB
MKQRIDGLPRWLVQRAARGAPPSLSERLEEEWLSHLETRSGRLAQLLFGAGCCWATSVIAYEHGEQKVAATGSTTGQKVMAAYAPFDSFAFSRRTTTLLAIVGLHGLLIYALQAGLGHKIIEPAFEDLKVSVLKDPQKTVEPLPPPPVPDFKHPPVQIPEPVWDNFDFPPAPDTIHDVAPQTTVPPVQPVPQKVVNRVLGGPGKGFPATDDYYPATARRMGETGVATIRVCVDERGRLTEAPALAQTSGSARLDEGALKLAKAGSGHYRPTTEDGRAVSSCYPFRIKYALKD